MTEPSRHWDGAGLERKIRAAGRPWTVGDISMVADGQWGVGAQSDRWPALIEASGPHGSAPFGQE
ncbi:hypothetical protein ACF1CG_36505 [Streptomyces sp. NPDC014773]|uniref:hypothetical protein n=1 Tax=Streptomyces sp. NPDC014773 TaxID=3364908 RepID=UPI0036FAFBB8